MTIKSCWLWVIFLITIISPVITKSELVRHLCSNLSTCTSCVTSECYWCIHEQKCVEDYPLFESDCPPPLKIFNETSSDFYPPWYLRFVEPDWSSECPKMYNSNNKSEILVHSGSVKQMQVKINRIAQEILHRRSVFCRFSIESRVIRTKGIILDDTIYCDAIRFEYSNPASYVDIPLMIIWDYGGENSLENPDNVHIRAYKCQRMAEDCEMCLTMHGKYNCGWCRNSGSCQMKEDCLNGEGIWFSDRNRNHSCQSDYAKAIIVTPTSIELEREEIIILDASTFYTTLAVLALIVASTLGVIFVLWIAYRKKSEFSERTITRMKKQVAVLELRTAIVPDVIRNVDDYDQISDHVYESIYEPLYLDPITNVDVSDCSK